MLNPGLKIAHYRTQKGWSQAQLAIRASIAQANLSNIEKGKRDFTVSTLLRLASALEVRPSQIIEEESLPPPIVLTRPKIEFLAKAVIDPKIKIPSELKELVSLFRLIRPQSARRVSTRKIQQAWMRLRNLLPGREIQGIHQRIEDALQRNDAKTTN